MRAGSPPDRLRVPIAIALVAYLILALLVSDPGDLVYLLGRTSTGTPGAEPARSGSPSISAACRTSPRRSDEAPPRGRRDSRSCATARRSSRSMPSAPAPAGRLAEGSLVDGQIQCPWHAFALPPSRTATSARDRDVRPARLRGPARRAAAGSAPRLPLRDQPSARASSSRVECDPDERTDRHRRSGRDHWGNR